MSTPDLCSPSPLLSVMVVTYNHRHYIRQALDSVIMQRTEFPFEICLGEDESSDGTREICKDYATAHPRLIRLFLRRRNDVVYIEGKATGRHNFLSTLAACRGKYVALLEGDDYWTDPLKLKKQVDILEQNPEINISFHNINVIYDDGRPQNVAYTTSKLPVGQLRMRPPPVETSFKDLSAKNFIHTPSVVFRRTISFEEQEPRFFRHVAMADWPLHLMNSRTGKIHFTDEIMATYRVHGKSVWSSRRGTDQHLATLKTFLYLIYSGVFSSVERSLLQSGFEKLYHRTKALSADGLLETKMEKFGDELMKLWPDQHGILFLKLIEAREALYEKQLLVEKWSRSKEKLLSKFRTAVSRLL